LGLTKINYLAIEAITAVKFQLEQQLLDEESKLADLAN
jgi:hypothetical protein